MDLNRLKGLIWVRIWGVLIISTLILCFAGTALANKVEQKDKVIRMIVSFKENATNQVLKNEILNKAGVIKLKELPIINGVVVQGSSKSKEILSRKSEVLVVTEDTRMFVNGKPSKPASPPQQKIDWGVSRINAPSVWSLNSGAGVRVAVLDTGIDLDHPDLITNIKGGVNIVNSRKSPNDDNGHGTHVAGIIAGINNNEGIVGVAPQASLVAVKVLDRSGSGFISDIIQGLEWCIKDENDIQIINMSLGGPSEDANLHAAIQKAYNKGIVLVAAAGNEGPGENTVSYPAKYPEVIAISATDINDNIPSWSSRGSEVELTAPGSSILSTYKDGGYQILSGTSMASPHAAGVAALVISSGISDGNGDGRINDEVRQIMQSGAEELGEPGKDNLFGYGIVKAGQ